ncbi:MAG: HD-GYP domain-containing protein, partial [Gallionellaceae bacterium]|nr:HD-GYP domain-containing protein [Gallionellaceae bacterium]
MIKKIPLQQLKVGMYVNDLNLVWPAHPFAWQCFTVADEATLNKFLASGIVEIEINTTLGADVALVKVAPIEPVPPVNEISSLAPNLLVIRTPAEEFESAKNLYANANKMMQNMMQDVRMGKQVQLAECEPMVNSILESMFRSPSTLLPLAQMKTRDEYTFQHSVSVAALAVAFGRVLNLQRAEIKEIALGGMLHDVGKAKVPGRILNKPGKLDDAEFVVMKNHAANTAEVLKEVAGISDIAFKAAAQHHERFDGTGYPMKLKGEEISLYGQMIAIVDVYDAITSIRVYHKGMPPTEALKKLFEWGGTHFNPSLVQAFIKGVGIYPAGSLVRMESGMLG